jgi:hypothetical protein
MTDHKREQMLERLQYLEEMELATGIQETEWQAKLEDPQSPVEAFGAPTWLRALVARSPSPEDKLATIKKHFPMAKAVESWKFNDPETQTPMDASGENYVYIDSESGKKVVFNKPGLDAGDVVEHGRTAAQIVGGVGAGMLASPSLASGPPGVALTAAAGALGSTAGGALYDGVMEKAFGAVDSRGSRERMSQNVSEFGADFGMGMVLPGVGGAVRGMLKQPGAAGVQKAADSLQKAYNVSVPLTPGMVGNSAVQNAEQAMIKLPIVGTTMPVLGTGLAKRQAQSLMGSRNASDAIGAQMGRVQSTPTLGGVGVREHAGRGVANYFKRDPKSSESFIRRHGEIQQELYAEVDSAIPPDQVITMGSVTALSKDAEKAFGKGTNAYKRKVPKEYKEMLEDIENANGQFSWKQADGWRQIVGEMIDDTGVANTDASQKALKRLYAAITSDQETAAREAGPDALWLLKQAKGHTKAMNTRGDALQAVIGEKDPVKVYERMVNMTTPELRSTYRELIKTPSGQAAWDDYRATYFYEMGKTTPGAMAGTQMDAGLGYAAKDEAGDEMLSNLIFSPARFVSNFERISQNGMAKVLFTDPEIAAIKDLRAVASAQAKLGMERNTSNTAFSSFIQNMILWGGLPSGSPDGIIAATGLAQAMQSPWFVRWLAEGAKQSTQQAGGHIGRLMSQASRDANLMPFAQYVSEQAKPPQQYEPSRRRSVIASEYLGTENTDPLFNPSNPIPKMPQNARLPPVTM